MGLDLESIKARVATGSTFAADVPALLARVAELEATVKRAIASYEAMAKTADALMAERDNLDAENTRFRQERDAVKGDLADAMHRHDETRSIMAERDAMRPVVEAAKSWRQMRAVMRRAIEERDRMYRVAVKPESEALLAAVDAYIEQGEYPQAETDPAPVVDETPELRRRVEELRQDAPSAGLNSTQTAQMAEVVDDTPELRRRVQELKGGVDYRHYGWQPAKDGDTPGELVPGEGDVTAEPESYCHRCDRPNVIWSAPSPLWNAVMRGNDINGQDEFDGIVCPVCFAELAKDRGIAEMWWFEAERVHAELTTTTPSGRTWDAAARMWIEGDVTDEPRADRDVMAAQEFDAHERNPPADPAGLDAAVEAAASVIAEANYWNNGTSAAGPSAQDRLRAESIVRAAAPHIRRAALNEAADEVKAMVPTDWEAQISVAALCDAIEALLRERAERET